MSELTRAVIFDLDGTLSDHRHRLSLAPYSLQGEHILLKDHEEAWRPYHEACREDPVHKITRKILWTVRGFYKILYATGRPEIYRDITEQWLADYNLSGHDFMLMRSVGDITSQADLKIRMAKEFKSKGYEIVMAFEDQPVVAKAYNSIGIPTFLYCE